MRRAAFAILCLVMAAPAGAAPNAATLSAATPSSSFDVAPTTLDLTAGQAGLFYVTNHGDRPLNVQIEALDWSQDAAAMPDRLVPSQSLFTSPPFARIFPGARQSVRVLARPAGDGLERAYRLRVSELPDGADSATGVHVLLQFSVPVFVGHDAKAAPDLVWEAAAGPGGTVLTARNRGRDAVKLMDLTLNGASLNRDAFVYILPGAAHRFTAAAAGNGALHLRGRDARSGRDLALDLTAHP